MYALYDNSTVGPNISNMTIQVEHRAPRTGQFQLHMMPVIRHPNFSDRTNQPALSSQRLPCLCSIHRINRGTHAVIEGSFEEKLFDNSFISTRL